MLHVAFDELPRRRPQQLLATNLRRRIEHRQRILNLVAKAEGASGLVEGRSPPNAADQRLIEQPAIDHEVDGRVGSPNLHRGQQLVPETAYWRQRRLPRGRAPDIVAASARAATASVVSPRTKVTLVLSPAARFTSTCSAAHGSMPASARLERPCRSRAAGRRWRAVAAEELDAIRTSPCAAVGARPQMQHGSAIVEPVWIAGEDGAARRVDFRDDEHRRLFARPAQCPLGVVPHAQSPRPAVAIRELDSDQFDRVVGWHEDAHFRRRFRRAPVRRSYSPAHGGRAPRAPWPSGPRRRQSSIRQSRRRGCRRSPPADRAPGRSTMASTD